MKRSVVPQALTVGLMAGILGLVGFKQRMGSVQSHRAASAQSNASSADVAAGSPESVVWRMVDASRAGDPTRYLECYTGELEPRLRRDFQEMGEARSRDYLLDAHRQLRGIAVRSAQMNSPLEGQIPVEYVYEDRSEVQQVHVKKVDGLWKIDRVEGAERIKTLVPYGAPVQQ